MNVKKEMNRLVGPLFYGCMYMNNILLLTMILIFSILFNLRDVVWFFLGFNCLWYLFSIWKYSR